MDKNSGANAKILNEKMQSPLHLASEMNRIAALEIMAKFRKLLDPNLPGGILKYLLWTYTCKSKYIFVMIFIQNMVEQHFISQP